MLQIVSIFRYVNMGEQGLQLSPQILEICILSKQDRKRNRQSIIICPPHLLVATFAIAFRKYCYIWFDQNVIETEGLTIWNRFKPSTSKSHFKFHTTYSINLILSKCLCIHLRFLRDSCKLWPQSSYRLKVPRQWQFEFLRERIIPCTF